MAPPSFGNSPSLAPSVVEPVSIGPELFRRLDGRRAVAGRYMEEGFVAGGGMDRLALPTFPPTVPASANLLFRFDVELFGEVDNNEWDGVRPVVPIGTPIFLPSVFSGGGGLRRSTASLWSVPSDAGLDVALSMLALWDNDAISGVISRQRKGCYRSILRSRDSS